MAEPFVKEEMDGATVRIDGVSAQAHSGKAMHKSPQVECSRIN